MLSPRVLVWPRNHELEGEEVKQNLSAEGKELYAALKAVKIQ